MFNKRKSKLFDVPVKSAVAAGGGEASGNAFLEGARIESSKTLSGNNALKYSSTGNSFVDQFGNLAKMLAPRETATIFGDMSTIYAENPDQAVKFAIYVRLITRVTQLPDGTYTDNPQRGAGLRHESIMRMIWLAQNHPEVFWENFNLFIAAGSWKDVFTMLSYDLQYNGWDGKVLDWKRMTDLLLAGLENPNTTNLIKKYMPSIRAKSRCKTVAAQADNLIAKYLTHRLFCQAGEETHPGHYKQYRQMKTSGTAHSWQKLISQKQLGEIDYGSVHGKALMLLVSSKFLKNNNLETAYEKWIDSQPVAKFTGFPHELFLKYGNQGSGYYSTISLRDLRMAQAKTLNKQFLGLVETAKQGIATTTRLIGVRDVSGSMSSNATGINMACGDVAKALSLFLSYLLPDGAFANHWIEFASEAKLKKWTGSTPVENWSNDGSGYIGNTNFQSVINLFTKMKRQGIDEAEFPTGIVCFSDGEFDSADLGQTNVQSAYKKLREAGFSQEYVDNFQIVLWDLANNYYGDRSANFETAVANQKNVFYFSGYDVATVAFLTGIEGPDGEIKEAPQTAEELFHAAMDQELLDLVKIS